MNRIVLEVKRMRAVGSSKQIYVLKKTCVLGFDTFSVSKWFIGVILAFIISFPLLATAVQLPKLCLGLNNWGSGTRPAGAARHFDVAVRCTLRTVSRAEVGLQHTWIIAADRCDEINQRNWPHLFLLSVLLYFVTFIYLPPKQVNFSEENPFWETRMKLLTWLEPSLSWRWRL
jgi:hypothetical protein